MQHRRKRTVTLAGLVIFGMLTPMLWGQTDTDTAESDNRSDDRREVAGPGSDYGRNDASRSPSGGNAGGEADFAGYDFGRVVEQMEQSVSPLQREMDRSFEAFTERIDQAEQLLEANKPREAVETATAAVEGVLAVRDDVLEPMWEGQRFLAEQVGEVRSRLAEAVEAGGEGESTQLDQETEASLDRIARRIAAEDDALRKKRLVAHYRSVRDIARIKQLERRLSPDERKLWVGVLSVLEQATLAHQQVLMGSEVLFAQLEATAGSLQEYLELMDTVDGARRLLGVVNGAEEGAGMAGFAASMSELQGRLGGFNDAVQQSLESSMFDLEAQVDAIQPTGEGIAGVASGEVDAELQRRLESVVTSSNPNN